MCVLSLTTHTYETFYVCDMTLYMCVLSLTTHTYDVLHMCDMTHHLRVLSLTTHTHDYFYVCDMTHHFCVMSLTTHTRDWLYVGGMTHWVCVLSLTTHTSDSLYMCDMTPYICVPTLSTHTCDILFMCDMTRYLCVLPLTAHTHDSLYMCDMTRYLCVLSLTTHTRDSRGGMEASTWVTSRVHLEESRHTCVCCLSLPTHMTCYTCVTWLIAYVCYYWLFLSNRPTHMARGAGWRRAHESCHMYILRSRVTHVCAVSHYPHMWLIVYVWQDSLRCVYDSLHVHTCVSRLLLSLTTHTYETIRGMEASTWVTSHIYLKKSCHKYASVMAYLRSPVTHLKESCHTVMSHICISHGAMYMCMTDSTEIPLKL